jgi:hypothetical protein
MNLSPECNELFLKAPFDKLTFGSIDFKKSTYEYSAFMKDEDNLIQKDFERYFDLASITKILSNALSYLLLPELFTPEMILCLNHRGGLPSWGLLPSPGWEEIVQSYVIKEAPTLYSDYSPLRVMLEFNKKSKEPLEKLVKKFWDKECKFWLDFDGEYIVHDPNAKNLKTFCSHAGAFATFGGLARTIIKMNQNLDLLNVMKKRMLEDSKNRFVGGWDRVEDLEKTSAGKGVSLFTFGHLGFTGTSLWIDIEKQKAVVILTNATQKYWYAKDEIILLRKLIGSELWK